MSSIAPVTESAYERLLNLVDHLATDVRRPLGPDEEHAVATLCDQAVGEGSVDRELGVRDTARWLVGLAHAHRAVQVAHPEVLADDDLAHLRLIITRWLHPARPDR